MGDIVALDGADARFRRRWVFLSTVARLREFPAAVHPCRKSVIGGQFLPCLRRNIRGRYNACP